MTSDATAPLLRAHHWLSMLGLSFAAMNQTSTATSPPTPRAPASMGGSLVLTAWGLFAGLSVLLVGVGLFATLSVVRAELDGLGTTGERAFNRIERSGDAVADFRRQIDALSPEARRGVADRVRRLERDDDSEGTTDRGA
jgi:hypothetical protein